MLPPLLQLLVVIVACLWAVYYYNSLKVRELATQAVGQHCKQMDLQLLDQSVSLVKAGLVRSKHTAIGIARLYQFEFTSTGDERYRGWVVMTGNRCGHIELAAHRFPENENVS